MNYYLVSFICLIILILKHSSIDCASNIKYDSKNGNNKILRRAFEPFARSVISLKDNLSIMKSINSSESDINECIEKIEPYFSLCANKYYMYWQSTQYSRNQKECCFFWNSLDCLIDKAEKFCDYNHYQEIKMILEEKKQESLESFEEEFNVTCEQFPENSQECVPVLYDCLSINIPLNEECANEAFGIWRNRGDNIEQKGCCGIYYANNCVFEQSKTNCSLQDQETLKKFLSESIKHKIEYIEYGFNVDLNNCNNFPEGSIECRTDNEGDWSKCYNQITDTIMECNNTIYSHWESVTDISKDQKLCCSYWNLNDCLFTEAEKDCHENDFKELKKYYEKNKEQFLEDMEQSENVSCKAYPSDSKQCERKGNSNAIQLNLLLFLSPLISIFIFESRFN